MKPIFVTGLLASILIPGAAAETVWGIHAYSDVCRITLEEDATRIGQGEVRHLDDGCRVGPFDRYVAGKNGTVRLLDRSGRVQMALSPDGEGYSGVVGDGDPATMTVLQSRGEPHAGERKPGWSRPDRRPHGETPGRGASADTCVRYADTNRCADDHDLGLPGERFDLLPIQTRVRMTKRFMASRSSMEEGQVGPGVCMDVRNCTESMINDEIWCEVEHDGDRSWILKQDKDYVYAGAGCG